jgi:putative transcriptional regulator
LKATTNIAGKVLIAMPDMDDARFDRSVILLCAHSEDGAMGLRINLPTEDVALSDLAQQLDLDRVPDFHDRPVHSGGPVEQERGFVLHTADYASAISTLAVTPEIGMTGTLDVIEDLVDGSGPETALICLGYCGWGPGQLEGEIAQNAWLVGDAPKKLVFGTPDARKWETALAISKVSPLNLSTTAGHA